MQFIKIEPKYLAILASWSSCFRLSRLSEVVNPIFIFKTNIGFEDVHSVHSTLTHLPTDSEVSCSIPLFSLGVKRSNSGEVIASSLNGGTMKLEDSRLNEAILSGSKTTNVNHEESDGDDVEPVFFEPQGNNYFNFPL
jgi:hypothetical protein